MKNPNPSFYHDWNNGIATLETSLFNWFSNTEPVHCPIIGFDLFFYNPESYTYELYNRIQTEITSSNELRLNTLPNNLKKSLAVRARTFSPQFGFQLFDFLICG